MSIKPTVLIVDDVPENIQIIMEVLKNEYAIITATSGEKALKVIRAQHTPDIILLDIMMPGMDGYDVCKNLKEDENTRNIPIIFISAMSDDIDEAKGLDLGAVDYITKPINPDLVRKRVHNQLELKMYRDTLESLVHKRTKELNETRLEIIRKLGIAAEFKDNETGMHVMRMSHYCKLIAIKLGLADNEVELILNASPMHDIGKIGIPDNILLKPGKLDKKEWEIMKSHTSIGGKIIGEHTSKLLATARKAALTHHEKWDGTGYPNGLSGTDIPLIGRIVAVADVFDALTSERPYKRAWPIEKAVQFLEVEAGKHFDPHIVECFMLCMDSIKQIKEQFKD